MARLPVTGRDGGLWGEILNEYLTHEHFEDGTHNTSAILDVPPATGRIPASDPAASRGVQWRPWIFSVTIPLLHPSAGDIVAWRAPAKAKIMRLQGYRIGGNGVVINARRHNGKPHLPTDLSLSTAHSWLDGGPTHDADYATGDTLIFIIAALGGAVTHLTIQADMEFI